MKIKRILCVIFGLLPVFSLGACAADDKQTEVDEREYFPKFTVYNEKAEVVKDGYDSLFAAIDETGVSGKADWTVADKNGKEVFRLGKRNVLHMYSRSQYFGTTINKGEADAFLNEHRQSYVVTGTGTAYYGQSVTRMNSNDTETYGYEYNTGSYLYQFTAPGYRKLSQTVYLSEAKLGLSKNEKLPYNAYIFINTNGRGGACDMGLASVHGHKGKVYLFSFGFNNGFHIHEDLGPITEFKYNETTDEYEFADDIYLEYTMDEKGTYLYAKNLATGVEMECSELLEKSEFKQIYEETWKQRPFLQATSLVPDLGKFKRNLWDPRSGAYLRNVRYSDITAYKVDDETPYEFFPSSPATYYGFSYADDCSSFREYTEDNKKYVVHDIAYDGTIK